jgi:glycine betaine/proline transport system permease protein
MDPEESHIPRIPIGDLAADGIDWLRTNWSGFFDAIDAGITFLNDKLTYGFVAIQPLVLIAILALLAWMLRSWKLAVGSVITFLLVLSMDMWEAMLQTMSLVLIATVIAVIIAVPVGILAATSRAASAVIRPILDFMQTMPAFVYLIPAVFFFHVGIVPGLVSTIVFAMPPGRAHDRAGHPPGRRRDRRGRRGLRRDPLADPEAASSCRSPMPERSWPASTRSSCSPCRWPSSPA